MTPEAFIELLGPCAQASMHSTGVPASYVVAAAALESGWGASQLAQLGKNLFGVKADAAWQGEVLTLDTREFLNGAWLVQSARWRKYADWQGSLDDHAAFLLRNPRYAPCFECSTGEAFAHAVAQAGYATDPDYAAKLVAIMRGRGLRGLDG